MIRRILLLVSLLAAGPLAAEEVAPPFEMVRTLQTLQAQIAGGNAAAVAAQRELLGLMERRSLAADPAVWRDGRNARAAVTYTLSGGSPRLMRRLLSLQPPIAVDADLARGALAYIENHEEEARKRLLPIDARALPMSLSGQVALVQAGLIAREDIPKAIRLLDDARLLMPGTLVEEAALRREVFLIAQTGNLDRFEFLSRQYLRRFGTSIYAEDFRQRFATAIARLGIADGDDRFPRLEAILKSSDPENQRALFLQLAQAAVVHGKLGTARSAAADAAALAPLGGSDAMRAGLYDAAASIVAGRDIGDVRKRLDSLNRRQLGRRDTDLLDAAVAVAAAVGEVPAAPSPLDPVPVVAADAQRGDKWVTATMRTAEAGLSAADALLEKANSP
ncbi:chemotaxis protein [Pleomorphomonas diazotrophica]|uniref:Chemotaxis protein n=1 Tax=Pleomorphomonas diazotrophica TaxID=1166257 RepID=A0A1I4QGA3_9HYPH|nr:chemotaxis protein [Pleomorphomonas diazotrophica]PKR90682.1 chemotaxis protein [Pleomorphomonas diazotrophica]SFM39088.1 chemotaxis protein MotC [Pleomorphomonas diazotrophica]